MDPKIKDPQIILLGYVKKVSATDREIVVVSLPPIIDASTSKLLERTLIANVPGPDSFGNTINCYLKQHLFDEQQASATDYEDRRARQRDNDPQVVLSAIIKTVSKTGHKLLVVSIPSDGLYENILVINAPSHGDEDVLCYLKYKMKGERNRRLNQQSFNEQEDTSE